MVLKLLRAWKLQRSGSARSERGERVAESFRRIAVFTVVLAAGVASGCRHEVNEVPVLVDVLEGMQQRFLPGEKQRGSEEDTR
jgi:hypothetical protein